MFNSYLTLCCTSYCTSYLTKRDKVLKKELKILINSCYEIKIEAHICIQKMGNAFLNAQQMLAQLNESIVLSIPFYHAFKTFKVINTSPL